MATHLSCWPIFIFTFLMVSSLLTSAQEISLVKEPDLNYYIVKKVPVVIVCQAKNAAEIAFTCLGTQIPSTSVEVKDVSDIDPDLTEAEIEVTRADVQNTEGQGPFWCQCSAVDNEGNVVITSRKATVSIASLKSKFETEPISATVTMGQDVEFACDAPEGHPKPEIMWRKDKKRLEVENNPRIYVTQKDSLVIQSVILADKGQYQCVARNVAGRRESQEAQLTVTGLAESAEPDLELLEQEVPSKKSPVAGKLRTTRQSTIKTYFTTEPKDKYFITDDKPATIDCGVVAADILTFRCNGKRMDRDRQSINQGLDSAGNRVIQAQISINIVDWNDFIKSVQQDQPFQCVCVAWFQDSADPNGWGRIDSNLALGFIHLAYLDTAFKTEPSDVTAGLNSDAVLICEPPKGQPSPWVYWYKDRTRLDPRTTEKYSMNAKGHLTVHHVQYEDAGTYNCLAENSVSSAQSRPGRLIVTAESATTTPATLDSFPTFPSIIPSTPVFLRDFDSEYTIGPDGTKTMICAVMSADQMTIDCGGQRLAVEDYNLRSEIHRETGKRLLYVSAVITEERIQRNPNDFFCQCTAWFLNQEGKWERISSSQGFIKPAPASQNYIEDEFVTPPEDTDATFESEAELYCQPPAGNPVPTVYWLKDGVRIDFEADPNFVLMDSGSLFIELVRVQDEGEYTCVAENDAGMRKSQPIQFTVLEKPVIDGQAPTRQPETGYEATTYDYDSSTIDLEAPVFVRDLEPEYYVADRAPVTLSCTVVTAKTLLFVCNGEVLRETATTGFHFVHPQTLQTLRENSLNITKEKIDIYRGHEPYTCLCRAYHNKEGTPANAYITIESSPATIYIAHMDDRFRVEPEDTEVIKFDNVELQCSTPDGVPEPMVSWLKDNYPVVESDKFILDRSGNLIIERFNENDEGTYNCVANNSFTEIVSRPAHVTLRGSSKPVPKPDKETAESEPGTTPSDTEKLYSGKPYISKDLHSVYYLVRNKPVTITCEAYSVELITFTCGMQTVVSQETMERMEELSLHDGQSSLVKVVETSINISKGEVKDYGPEKEYWCKCYGHYRDPVTGDRQTLESVKGVVEIAYLKKDFQKEPESRTVDEGDSLTIPCQPPLGNPPPKVTWTKNGEDIEPLSITSAGLLIIPDAQLEHAGQYICIAENVAGKHMSQAVTVDVKAMDGTSPSKPGQKCPQLKECASLISNNLDAMDKSVIPLNDLCMDHSEFLQCVDHNLENCNVTKSSPEEDVKASFFDIGNWFTELCNRLHLNSEKSESCDKINQCELHYQQLAADNATYWCSILQSLDGCISSAASNCHHEDLDVTSESAHFHSHFIEKYCPVDISMGGLWTEVTAEPEGVTDSKEVEDPEPEGNKDVTKPTNGDEKGEGGNTENKETGAEGKHNGGDLGSEEDFENNNEDADRENEDVVVTSKTKDKYNTNSDNSEEEDSSSEDYFNERDERNHARKKEEDREHAERGRPHVNDEKYEEEDNNMSIDGIPKTLAEDDDSINQVEDEDQGKVEASVVEGEKDISSAVLAPSEMNGMKGTAYTCVKFNSLPVCTSDFALQDKFTPDQIISRAIKNIVPLLIIMGAAVAKLLVNWTDKTTGQV